MGFDELIADMDASIIEVFGVPALFNGTTSCTIVIDRNVERVLGSGELLVEHTELTINKSETGEIVKGDQFEVGAETFKVSRIITDDNSIIVVSVI